jgi:hypothetical protein
MTAAAPPGADPLWDANREVGWIQDSIIAVRSSSDLNKTAYAAWVAYQAIARRLAARRDGGAVLADIPEPSALSLTPVDDGRLLVADGREIAFLRPDHASTGAPVFRFEIRVPPPNDRISMNGLAYRMMRSLHAAGVTLDP